MSFKQGAEKEHLPRTRAQPLPEAALADGARASSPSSTDGNGGQWGPDRARVCESLWGLLNWGCAGHEAFRAPFLPRGSLALPHLCSIMPTRLCFHNTSRSSSLMARISLPSWAQLAIVLCARGGPAAAW